MRRYDCRFYHKGMTLPIQEAKFYYQLPSMESDGQSQRAAIARALANDPELLVADVPTGNLDSRTSRDVFDLFSQVVGQGKTLLMVTHDKELAQACRVWWRFSTGR